MGVTRGLVQLKIKLTQGFGIWIGWLAPGGPVALEEGQIGFWIVDSTSLIVLGELNHIIITIHHIFNPMDQLDLAIESYQSRLRSPQVIYDTRDWYQSMVQPMEWMVRRCLSYIHVACICAFYVCMVMVIVQFCHHVQFDDVLVGLCLSCIHVSYICVHHVSQCLYVCYACIFMVMVMHAQQVKYAL